MCVCVCVSAKQWKRSFATIRDHQRAAAAAPNWWWSPKFEPDARRLKLHFPLCLKSLVFFLLTFNLSPTNNNNNS